jgi:hypothetical protein
MVNKMNGQRQQAAAILSEARQVASIETDCACSTAEADCDCACSVGDCACEDFDYEMDGWAWKDCACVDGESELEAGRLAADGGKRATAVVGLWQTGRPMVRQRLSDGWTAALSGRSPYCAVYQRLLPEVARLEWLRLLQYSEVAR